MATFISHSPAETERLGETWGRAAESGLVLGLSGDLGAGKTQFVKGVARGLGISARVHSPTFALVNIYEGGRLTLFHLDLYRLSTPEQVIAAGLEEYFQPRGVTIIEWAERWFGLQPAVHGRESQVSTLKPQVQSPKSNCERPELATIKNQLPCTGRVFHVYLETLSETERRISYEDPGP
jgi:tRNA threonylcarbamoyladenosine biosynthesis protein TsaE